MATAPLTFTPDPVRLNTTTTSATALKVSPHRLTVWATNSRRNPRRPSVMRRLRTGRGVVVTPSS